MSKPLVSVVIPTFSRSCLIKRSLKSVLQQSYTEFEVIVIDDNGLGTDEQRKTESEVKEFEDARILYFPLSKNVGGAEARNIGISKARGKYIAFLDDDEDWVSKKLEKQVNVLEIEDLIVGAVDSGFYDVINDQEVGDTSLPEMSGDIFDSLMVKFASGQRGPKLSTLLIRRSALQSIGGFDSSLLARQDYDFYLRFFKQWFLVSIQEPLIYKRHDAAIRISGNRENKAKASYDLYVKIKKDLGENPYWHGLYLLRHSLILANANKAKLAVSYYAKGASLIKGNACFKLRTFIKLLRRLLS